MRWMGGQEVRGLVSYEQYVQWRDAEAGMLLCNCLFLRLKCVVYAHRVCLRRPVPPRRLDIAGRDVTRYLIKPLLMRGCAFNRPADFEPIREIKEKLSYVSYDFDLDTAYLRRPQCSLRATR